MTTNKYSKGKVYKLVNNVDNEIYVGSTIQSLAKRKGGHKETAARKPNRRVYQHLIDIGWNNVEIILIENYPCQSKEELNARERYWIEELKASLNKAIPTRTKQEWESVNVERIRDRQAKFRAENKEMVLEITRVSTAKWHAKNAEIIRERRAKYRNENADKVREYHAKWRAENADIIRERQAKYRNENAEKVREYHAKWCTENAEKMREYQAKYREANREAINAKAREKKAQKKAEREAAQIN